VFVCGMKTSMCLPMMAPPVSSAWKQPCAGEPARRGHYTPSAHSDLRKSYE